MAGEGVATMNVFFRVIGLDAFDWMAAIYNKLLDMEMSMSFRLYLALGWYPASARPLLFCKSCGGCLSAWDGVSTYSESCGLSSNARK